jgi:iron complex outermembrane receptor protein
MSGTGWLRIYPLNLTWIIPAKGGNMKRQSLSTFLILFFFSIVYGTAAISAEILIRGHLESKSTGKPVSFANIILETGKGGYSDKSGDFNLKCDRLPIALTISHIAYRDTTLVVADADLGTIYLIPEVLSGEDVFVTATRAVKGKTPVAFSELTEAEIQTRYTVEDVPMILALEPGVYSYSESGNGTGYSYVQVRGFDQSRIAVMLNNVPLNDNESHQVYWVDHGDILADADMVQIQRGIGNSLYGSSAFGGSVNVLTSVGTEQPSLSVNVGAGSYNTSKISLKASSGKLYNNKINLFTRLSQIQSDGYRDYHHTIQKAASFGGEYDGDRFSHQLRVLIGYENSQLMWDGVSADDINDRQRRRAGYKSYIDDFLQQVYSLNSTWKIADYLRFSNVAYLVKGSGYYESEKSSGYDFAVDDSSARADFRDFLQAYNLDAYYPGYPWESYSSQQLEFTRRKWIVNSYYGIIPALTLIQPKYRLDVGGELRFYSGNHFGKIAEFSDLGLASQVGSDWYQYYRYIGKKMLTTAFIHSAYDLLPKLKLIADLQYQRIIWNLDQKRIGHAQGYQMEATWNFVNPRIGAIYSLTNNFTVFTNYGKAQKEPADDQIIEADDIWGEPRKAAAELINDVEIGGNYHGDNFGLDLNLYRISYHNEQLKNIDIEQEGEYAYYQADATLHQGLEAELHCRPAAFLSVNLNASFSQHIFDSGDNKKNTIPNIPGVLGNGSLVLNPWKKLSLFLTIRYVGKQYIDDQNIGTIAAYWLTDVGARYRFGQLEISGKINNLLNCLYSTYGYGYEWGGYYAYYWPGATRNGYFAVTYCF